ncbi:MAG: glycosyltransferase [Actinobacteria bacterium]|nr:glycosyltransferase [Actinomycetota bacterium]
MDKKQKIEFFNSVAKDRKHWKKKSWYYHKKITQFMKFIIPEGSSVLEIGCSTGDLLNELKPGNGVGIDSSANMIEIAKKNYPELTFIEMDADKLNLDHKFDYIILSDLIGYLDDVQTVFENLQTVCHPKTKIVVTYYNFLWESTLKLGEKLRLKMKEYHQNWLSKLDILNLLDLANFETIRSGAILLLPVYIPILSEFLNKYISKFFYLSNLCFINYSIARPMQEEAAVNNDYSCSVIIPARNETESIERAVQEIPEMGRFTEIIFVEGHSKDNTLEEIKRVCEKYKNTKNIKYYVQDGKGKKDAVFKGFDIANGDILMILDADLTVAPRDLQKFYNAIASGKGEFINGSRFVYPREKEAMRFLRMTANKFFSLLFTWILGKYFKDTLCGTKVIFKSDYEKLKKSMDYFGNFDRYGDYDLILGSYKQNLKIVEIPVHYKSRTYGSTNIGMWKGGTNLLRTAFHAMKKIKFI